MEAVQSTPLQQRPTPLLAVAAVQAKGRAVRGTRTAQGSRSKEGEGLIVTMMTAAGGMAGMQPA